MRDENQRRATPRLEREEEIDDLAAGLAVEIAGRLIGEQEARARDERAGERHTLLLATGELCRKMRHAMREPDLAEQLCGALEGIRLTAKLQRQRDVLLRRHGRHEMEGLEDNADAGAAREGERILAHGGEIVPGNHDASGSRLLEPRHDHEERGLARSARPHDGDRITSSNGKAQITQDGDLAGAAREREIDIRQLDDGLGNDGEAP